MRSSALKKVGLGGGAGAALVVAGAMLVGGPATAATSQATANAPKPTRGTQISGTSVSVQPGGNGLATVTCPAGTVVTGGGGQTSAFRIFFTDSYRSGNGWVVRGTNTNPSLSESISAVAVCQRTNSVL